MDTIETIADDLIAGFEECKDFKDMGGQGGAMRTAKGKTWEKFGRQVLDHVVDRNKLPYFIEGQKKVNILDDLNITMDTCLTHKLNKEPTYHVEHKDYTDTKMYKTFIGDNLYLKYKYPHMKYISLSGWIASSKEVQATMDSISGLSGFVFSDTLLSIKRKAADNLFILSYSKPSIITAINSLIVRLEKVVK